MFDRHEKCLLLALTNDEPAIVEAYLDMHDVVNVKLSLDGLDIPPILKNGPPLIAVAIYLGARNCVASLITHRSNLSIEDDCGRNAIHFAVACDELEILQLLGEQGANLTNVDHKGRNILHYAAQFAHKDIVKWILAKKLLLNNEDREGYTPLHFAAESGSDEIIELLLNSGMKQTKSFTGVCFEVIGHLFCLLLKMIELRDLGSCLGMMGTS